MKIITENSLNHFEFWSGGADRASVLTEEQMDQVEQALEMAFPDGINETYLNDLFWFEEDYIASLCGFDSFADLEKFNKNNVKHTRISLQ